MIVNEKPVKALEEVESEEEAEKEEDEGKETTTLGVKKLSTGLIRLRFSNLGTKAIANAYTHLKGLAIDIGAAKVALPDLERFESILAKALERGGTQGALLAYQQGFQALEQLIENDSSIEKPKCAICLDELSKEPIVLGCLHLFCKECISLQKKAHDARNHPLSCPLCRREVVSSEMFLVLPEEKPTTTVTMTTTTTSNGENAEKKNAKDSYQLPEWSKAVDDEVVKAEFSQPPEGLTFDNFSSAFVGLPRSFQTFLRLAAGVEALNANSKAVPSRNSTKVQRVIDDIKAVEGKVVVFSQFTKSIFFLMGALGRLGIMAVKISRGDVVKELSSAVAAFNTVPECKVLVLHAGAAAAGLTLTVASHVILLEPFLKAGEEAQALNRVHRIGQNRNVTARCYFMRDSVEERILAWRRATKQNEPNQGAVDDGNEYEKGIGLESLELRDEEKSVTTMTPEFLKYVLGVSPSLT